LPDLLAKIKLVATPFNCPPNSLDRTMQAHSFKVRVDAVRDEAHGVRSFVISRLDGQPFDAYEPGAHIDVACPSGVTRQYSLCGDPARRDSHLFAVKRETSSRGGSRSLHDDAQIGTELSVGAPRNLFRCTARHARLHVRAGAVHGSRRRCR
jgi:ferredoxin-NADP reductase